MSAKLIHIVAANERDEGRKKLQFALAAIPQLL